MTSPINQFPQQPIVSSDQVTVSTETQSNSRLKILTIIVVLLVFGLVGIGIAYFALSQNKGSGLVNPTPTVTPISTTITVTNTIEPTQVTPSLTPIITLKPTSAPTTAVPVKVIIKDQTFMGDISTINTSTVSFVEWKQVYPGSAEYIKYCQTHTCEDAPTDVTENKQYSFSFAANTIVLVLSNPNNSCNFTNNDPTLEISIPLAKFIANSCNWVSSDLGVFMNIHVVNDKVVSMEEVYRP